jgi:hypothetical protein
MVDPEEGFSSSGLDVLGLDCGVLADECAERPRLVMARLLTGFPPIEQRGHFGAAAPLRWRIPPPAESADYLDSLRRAPVRRFMFRNVKQVRS